jgi:putative colanic acid biosysnthesis UDP-glucose lipid carrier transferase
MTYRGMSPDSSSRSVIARRAGDIVLGSMLLFVCLPALALASLAVWCERDGPPFQRQKRLTRDGRKIGILKLRTMRTTAFGPKITRTGDFLRRSHIDHIPLLFNVLKGDLSLVDPQPVFADGEASPFVLRQR